LLNFVILSCPPRIRSESAMWNPLEGIHLEKDQQHMGPVEEYLARSMP